MTRTNTDVEALARRLDEAQTTRTETPSLAEDASLDIELDVDTAYRIQESLIGLRTGRGEALVGIKLGFTSKAKMAQMGVSDVIVGRLTDGMQVPDGEETDLDRYIHPKVEPEVAYRISCDVDLADPEVDILGCVDAIAPALEIIDSRYLDFRFTYEDVVADNTSAAGFAIGPWARMSEAVDAADLEVRLRVGDQENTGTTAAILGDPKEALRALLDMCRRRGFPLRTGDVVLAGAATAAIRLGPATATCSVAGLGSVSLTGAHA